MSEMHFVILALALLLDRYFGDPDWLWRKYPHPVVWFGKAIEAAEKVLYPEQGSPAQKKRAGILLITGLVVTKMRGRENHGAVRRRGRIGPTGIAVPVHAYLCRSGHEELRLRIDRQLPADRFRFRARKLRRPVAVRHGAVLGLRHLGAKTDRRSSVAGDVAVQHHDP